MIGEIIYFSVCNVFIMGSALDGLLKNVGRITYEYETLKHIYERLCGLLPVSNVHWIGLRSK